jgi:hypothetical protein
VPATVELVESRKPPLLIMGGSRQYTAVFFYRVGTKRENNKNENTHALDESKYMDFSIRLEQKKERCHELLTFATRWRSVPATINITDKISTTDELVAIITRV